MTVQTAFAGYYQVRPGKRFVKAHRIQHGFNAHLQAAFKKRGHARAHAARRSRAGKAAHLGAAVAMQQTGKMGKPRVQLQDHGLISPLLGTKDRRRPRRAAEGVVNVAHGDDGNGGKGRVQPGQVDAGNVH